MRIDKFLKVARLVKRREIAKLLCDDGDVLINEKRAKPMNEVSIGDVIQITMGERITKVRVLEVRPYASKEEARAMIEILP